MSTSSQFVISDFTVPPEGYGQIAQFYVQMGITISFYLSTWGTDYKLKYIDPEKIQNLGELIKAIDKKGAEYVCEVTAKIDKNEISFYFESLHAISLHATSFKLVRVSLTGANRFLTVNSDEFVDNRTRNRHELSSEFIASITKNYETYFKPVLDKSGCQFIFSLDNIKEGVTYKSEEITMDHICSIFNK